MRNFLSSDADVAHYEAIVGVVVMFLLVSGGALYLVLRWTEASGDRRDPQIGLKAVLHFFYSLSILMALTGLTVVADDLFGREATLFTRRQRAGAGLFGAGLLFGFLHWLLLRYGTSDSERPAARRLFAGWRLALHGLVVIAAVALLLVDALQERWDRSAEFRTWFVVLCIWGPSWLIHLLLVWWRGMRDRTPGAPVSWEAE